MIIIIKNNDLDKYNFWHKSLSSLNVNIIEINSQIVLLKAWFTWAKSSKNVQTVVP